MTSMDADKNSPSCPGNPARRVWFAADLHANHPNLQARTGMSWLEREETYIANHNTVVLPGDEVWLLGDIMLSRGPKKDMRAKAEQLLNRLSGQLHLVTGNHDDDEITQARRWVNVQPYAEIKVNMGGLQRQKIVLFHYPIESWNGMHHGAWHLHGHCHGNLIRDIGPRMDVGIDVRGRMRPVPLGEVAAHMKDRICPHVDHHNDLLATRKVDFATVNSGIARRLGWTSNPDKDDLSMPWLNPWGEKAAEPPQFHRDESELRGALRYLLPTRKEIELFLVYLAQQTRSGGVLRNRSEPELATTYQRAEALYHVYYDNDGKAR